MRRKPSFFNWNTRKGRERLLIFAWFASVFMLALGYIIMFYLLFKR